MTFSSGCAFGDYDRDGDLDLFVAGYTRRAYARLGREKDAEARMAEFQRLSDQQRAKAVSEREDLVRRLAAVRF